MPPLRRRTRRTRRSRMLAVAGVLAAFGCQPSPDRDLVLSPVARLVDMVEPPLPADHVCGIHFDVRPTLGCISTVELFNAEIIPGTDSRIGVTVEIPAALRTAPLIIIPAVVSTKNPATLTLDRTLLVNPGETLDFAATVPEFAHLGPVKLLLHAAPARSTFPTWTSETLDIETGSEFRVALGLHPDLMKAGAGPVYFRLTASVLDRRSTGPASVVAAEHSVLLLDELVDPDQATRGWIERRIGLDALAGQRVRLHFSNRLPVSPKDTPPAAGTSATLRPAFSAPLWGAPRILAPRPRGAHRNVILLSLDTMRADLLGRHEKGRDVTPVLDQLGRDGAVFFDTISTFSSTTGSHMSILTSTYPAQHAVTFPSERLPGWIPTLTETMAAAGYATAAFTENAMISAASGFARGFDVFTEEKRADGHVAAGAIAETLARGMRWIRANQNSPFFVFLHTYQVHNPYLPPPDFDVFLPSDDVPKGLNKAERRQRQTTRMFASYLGEMLYADSRVGAFLRELDSLDLLDETLFVVTADHGEAFDEHGKLGHGFSVFEEQIRVPLLLWAPGLVPPGVQVTHQVSGIDVAPTILSLVDLEPPATFLGSSLKRFFTNAGEPLPQPVHFAEAVDKPTKDQSVRVIAARDGRHKWIFGAESSTALRIYDLKADPHERHPLKDQALVEKGRPFWHQLRRLQTAAQQRTRDELASPADQPAAPTLDADTTRKLEALGYIDPAQAENQ